eukprot:CAMPEP_0204578804 /NCGR_PEP_ID=MMETSP0661-20131031/43140_1 /ASSEMBLY_ACC=CAM_ASM_000606 /TAXON_ID=109239 /ORGANISM="Alexandrium margalefi, Strain AMGDE01CS-322" /LENGTH=136 /DNA_ID=CAMNT_0051587767 /DNA_START=42 /DNA_END=452 /DNA_ORIENTATION=-
MSACHSVRHRPTAHAAARSSRAHGLEDALQLLRQHHVPADLQLPAHEGLHAVELPLHHRHEVAVGHGDGHVRLRVVAPLCIAAPVLEVQAELSLGASIADHELEDGAAELDQVGALALHHADHAVEERLALHGWER